MSYRSLLMAGAALSAALMHSAPVQAQQSTTPPAAERRGPGPDRRGPPTVEERVARMTTELGLNADQATKIRAVLAAEQRGMDSVFARRTVARDAERTAMSATHMNTQKAMGGILTPDQKLRHDAMRARRSGPHGMNARGEDGGHRRGQAARRGDHDARRGPPDSDRRGPPNDGTTTR